MMLRKIAKAPNSAGVNNLLRKGCKSIGMACAIVIPDVSINTFLINSLVLKDRILDRDIFIY
jgi:hypothetical protein